MADYWLLDQGSSRLKWQVRSEDGRVIERGESSWAPASGKPLLPERTPSAVWLARVGGAARERSLLQAIRERHPEAPVHVVRPSSEGPLGLRLDYDGNQMGADRYCALLGVLARSAEPAVVIDAGTAVTIDLLGTAGRHLGGYILPGYGLGARAVADLLPDTLRRTLPTFSPNAAPHPEAPGHNTADALMGGWAQGLVAAVEHLGSWAWQTVPAAPQWWVTGGDGPWLSDRLQREVRLEPDLVLEGLWQQALHDLDSGSEGER
ncbi:MAG TPA: type III pantothenate kinase [Thioalkalivibrio sp.]|nr:type III pantothenate kinase [Thioalkalivibrio sp.]